MIYILHMTRVEKDYLNRNEKPFHKFLMFRGAAQQITTQSKKKFSHHGFFLSIFDLFCDLDIARWLWIFFNLDLSFGDLFLLGFTFDGDLEKLFVARQRYPELRWSEVDECTVSVCGGYNQVTSIMWPKGQSQIIYI